LAISAQDLESTALASWKCSHRACKDAISLPQFDKKQQTNSTAQSRS
jgi:hypothetical protein